jgi:hypothetical protein
LLAQGWWFSPGTPASSTTKIGRHDIAESGVKTPKIKIKNLVDILSSSHAWLTTHYWKVVYVV